MSQFIFDQIYGSEAKRKKIMQSSNFLYYRQMMKIKNKHTANPSLYTQLYTIPSYEESQKPVKLQKIIYSPDLLSTLNQNNYVIQKINPHAFKIVKRKQKIANLTKLKDYSFFNQPGRKVSPLHSERKFTSRSIDADARRIRNYLTSSQQKSPKKPTTALINQSTELNSNRTFRTYSRQKNSEYDTSAFSTFQQSVFDHRKN